MDLDIDIGNTRIKWRLADGNVHALPLADWQQMFRCLPVDIGRVRVSNVAGAGIGAAFAAECQAHLGLQPSFAKPQQGLGGLTLAYVRPESFGVDRWLALLAARQRLPGEALVVFSAGTALTADLVTSDGQHLGGFIVPGLQASHEALINRARQLPSSLVHLKADWSPGCSTEECIGSGFSALYQSFMNGVSRYAEQSLVRPRTLLTGGGGRELLNLLDDPFAHIYCESLVLDGLNVPGAA